MAQLAWHGEVLLLTAIGAAKDAINEVMEEMAADARANHPGWKSDTGGAEQSIRVLEPAKVKGKRVVGRWGSTGVPYFNVLEFRHGRALISAFDRRKLELFGRIRTKFKFAEAASRRRAKAAARALTGGWRRDRRDPSPADSS